MYNDHDYHCHSNKTIKNTMTTVIMIMIINDGDGDDDHHHHLLHLQRNTKMTRGKCTPPDLLNRKPLHGNLAG